MEEDITAHQAEVTFLVQALEIILKYFRVKRITESFFLCSFQSVFLNQQLLDTVEIFFRQQFARSAGDRLLAVKYKLLEFFREAAFRLTAGDRSAIQAKMDDLSARRREKQPLNLPSAGSTFKHPESFFAGALNAQAGLKGLRVGGACVSEKHAGFVVNDRGATARDVLDLIRLVQARVLEHSGVRLETEVRILGEE